MDLKRYFVKQKSSFGFGFGCRIMTHGFFKKTCYKSEDLLGAQCPCEGDSLETTQASFVTFHPTDCHMQAPGDTTSHTIRALLCFVEPLRPFLCTQNAWRTNYSSPFTRMVCDYKNTCPGLCSVLSALLLTYLWQRIPGSRLNCLYWL